jgi:hypothetical protein
MKRAQILSGLAGLALAATAGSALAQRSLYPLPQRQEEAPRAQPERPPQTNFDRDRNVSVRERQRPRYDAVGLQLGGFTAYPKLTVGAEKDDNIYATNANTREDTIYTVQPELTIQSQSAISQLQAFVRGGRRMNQDFVKETSTDYQAGASGYYDVGGIRLIGGGDYGRYTEPRTSTTAPTNTVKPVEYKLGQANIGLSYTLDRIRLTGRAETQDYDFSDGRTTANAEVDQDFRDRQILTYTAKAEYALTPDTSVFLVSAFDDRKYDRQPPAVALNRNSKGTDIALGASFDISALARGEIQLGYVKQDYELASLQDIKGMTGKATFEWFPTDLTTLTLTGSRDVRDAAVTGAGGFLSGNYALQVDQELLSNLILTARLGMGRDDYKGIDREDKRTSGYVGANYLLNRNLGFTLAYDYLKQESKGSAPGQSYEDNRVSLSSSVQF